MTTLDTSTADLVTGGNVRGGIKSPPRSGIRMFAFYLARGSLLTGLIGAVVGNVWGTLYMGYHTWTTHVTATATTFTATLAHVPAIAHPPFGVGIFPNIPLAPIGIIMLGALGMELALPSKRLAQSATWLLGVLTVTFAILLITTLLTLLGGAFAHLGNHPDDATVRTDADAWIATNLNLNSPYSVDFNHGYGTEPVFLRSVKPDGSLDRVYRIDNDGTTLSIKPTGK